jgi:CDGSH-type Zn-finger protein
MAEPVPAQKAPYPVDVQAGKKHFWCACGRRRKQPFRDGSHKEFGLAPLEYSAADSKTVWFRGCKATKSRPTCDGTHKTL